MLTSEEAGKEEQPLEMETCAATVEISLEVSQQLKIEPPWVSALLLLGIYLIDNFITLLIIPQKWSRLICLLGGHQNR